MLSSSPSAPDGQGFEGLQYLGAGLLALVVLMAAYLPTGRLDRERTAVLKRLLWLVPPFLVLGLLAIGPAPIWRGEPLFVAHLPPGVIDRLDAVRASGRLLWPATYTLAFAAIVTTTGWARATLVLGCALAVQVIDLTPMLAAVRGTSKGAEDTRRFARTNDPRWTRLIADASVIEFQPADPFVDLRVMEEVSWRAVVACRPVAYFYASREARTTRIRVDAQTRAFAAGRLDPTRLYILLGTARSPATVAGLVRTLDGVRFIPPSRPAPPPSCASSPRSAS